MAKRTWKRSTRIVIYVGPKIRKYLEEMKYEEIYGTSISAVAGTLLCQALRAERRPARSRLGG